MGSSRAQGLLWGTAPEVWSQSFEPATLPLFEHALDDALVTSGSRLLDAGCGAGLALQIAANRGAHVAGLDASAAMLSVARRRLPDAPLHLGDLETLPFDDDRFDVVTAFNSIQYAENPIRALRELRRVARTRARIVVSTWATAEHCESRTVFAALGRLLPPSPTGAGPFALSEPGQLEELVANAGLEPERSNQVAVAFEFATIELAIEAHLSTGPAQRAIETVGREATIEALRTGLQPSLSASGSSIQHNSFRYLVSTA